MEKSMLDIIRETAAFIREEVAEIDRKSVV